MNATLYAIFVILITLNLIWIIAEHRRRQMYDGSHLNGKSSENLSESCNRLPPLGYVEPKFVAPHYTCYQGRGVGNKLHLYAALYSIARRTNRIISLATSNTSSGPSKTPWLTDYFQLEFPYLPHNFRSKNSATIAQRHPSFQYDEQLFSNSSMHKYASHSALYINGFLTSYKYFVGYEGELRERLKFRSELRDPVNKFLRDQVTPSPRPTEMNGSNLIDLVDMKQKHYAVGIHIRRTDMMEQFYKKTTNKEPPGTVYFINSMNFYIRKFGNASERQDKLVVIAFVVCSDDMKWSKKTLEEAVPLLTKPENVCVRIIYSENHSAGFDLCLLSSCNATIITIGTFGWWAAWLNGGTTLYYKHFPDDKMSSWHKDIYPPEWIPME